MDAPCVAFVGPPNSGKTTLLHVVDEALQLHPSRPSVYVVKGQPDGTGRYLRYSPELRDKLKPLVKGRWTASTVDQICSWVSNARQNLELALLDFGGKHAPDNHRMLSLCSHFIVLARRLPDGKLEAEQGAGSWRAVCEENGLAPIAVVESVWQEGVCTVRDNPGGWLEGRFRADAEAPGDRSNEALVAALVARLLSLRLRRAGVGLIDLRLDRDWSPSDIPTLAGLHSHVEGLARSGAPLALEGRAPIWAYLAAMHRGLAINPPGEVRVFDPKLSSPWVNIPVLSGEASGFPAGALQAGWTESSRPGFCTLELRIQTEDRFLPDAAYQNLAGAPLPDPPTPPASKVIVSGSAPIWLHLAYSRWLRSIPTVRTIGVWDAKNTTEIVVGP